MRYGDLSVKKPHFSYPIFVHPKFEKVPFALNPWHFAWRELCHRAN